MDGWSRIIIQVPALRQCAFLRPLSHFCRKPRGWRTLEEVPAPQGFLHVDQESAREGFKLPVCGWPGPRLAPCTSQVAIPMKYLTKNSVERNEVSYSMCFRIVAGCPLLVGSTSPPVSWLSCIRYRCGGWGPGGFQNTDPRVENPPQVFFPTKSTYHLTARGQSCWDRQAIQLLGQVVMKNHNTAASGNM